MTIENKIHPEVMDAIEVSFFEDLFLGDQNIFNSLKPYFSEKMVSIVKDFENRYRNL